MQDAAHAKPPRIRLVPVGTHHAAPRRRVARLLAALITAVLAGTFVVFALPGSLPAPLPAQAMAAPASAQLAAAVPQRRPPGFTRYEDRLTVPPQPAGSAGTASLRAALVAPSATAGPGPVVSPPQTPAPVQGSPQQIAASMLGSYGWPQTQMSCLIPLWATESGWRYNASNPSGAYGIPQALPGSKMASAGPDWRTNPATQIRWGLGYIKAYYKTPCGAEQQEVTHGWY